MKKLFLMYYGSRLRPVEEVVSEALKEDDGAVVKDEEDKASDEPKNDVVEEKKKAGRPKKSKE